MTREFLTGAEYESLMYAATEVADEEIAKLKKQVARLTEGNEQLYTEVRKHKRQVNALTNKNVILKRRIGELDTGDE